MHMVECDFRTINYMHYNVYNILYNVLIKNRNFNYKVAATNYVYVAMTTLALLVVDDAGHLITSRLSFITTRWH